MSSDNSLISVFPDSDLRSGHHGLGVKARKDKIDTRLLSAGEFVLFINRAQTAFKMIAAGNILVHYKSAAGRIDTRTIKYLPHCFNGQELDYNKALGLVLKKTLGKRYIEE